MIDKTKRVCTKDHPWDSSWALRPVVHPDARQIGEQEPGWPGGDIVTYECPNCGLRWTKELPQ